MYRVCKTFTLERNSSEKGSLRVGVFVVGKIGDAMKIWLCLAIGLSLCGAGVIARGRQEPAAAQAAQAVAQSDQKIAVEVKVVMYWRAFATRRGRRSWI